MADRERIGGVPFMMGYDEAIDWLYRHLRLGMKLGLGNMLRLCEAFDHPERAVPCIHVAGTNGKGSVAAMLESILRSSGEKTGLFTSPHLIDFRERTRVRGGLPPREDVARLLSSIRTAVADWEHAPTFFEISTLLAFLLFREAECTRAVIETGMGGRLDSTNLVDPEASVITPIGWDHAAHLGDSLPAIAGEKAGIIKPGRPVVSAAQPAEIASVLRARAEATGSRIAFIDTPWEDGPIGLVGSFQRRNAALAVAALEAAGWSPGPAPVREGLRGVRWPGRFQPVGDRLILDGAHNPPGAEQLVATWRERFAEHSPLILFSGVREKDHPATLAVLRQLSDEIVLTPMKIGKAERLERLEASARDAGFRTRLSPDLRTALDSCAGRLTLATGSLFLVGEILELLADGADLFPEIGSLED